MFVRRVATILKESIVMSVPTATTETLNWDRDLSVRLVLARTARDPAASLPNHVEWKIRFLEMIILEDLGLICR